MSLINLNFLKENFNDEKIIFFDIGGADLWDTKEFAKTLPNAEIYAFEPLKNHYDICTKRAIEYGVKFFNYAISDINGDVLFYPSQTEKNNEQLQSPIIPSLALPTTNAIAFLTFMHRDFPMRQLHIAVPF